MMRLERICATLLILLLPYGVEANRLFTSGFELQSVTNSVEWHTSDTPIAAPTISTTTVRSGAASMRVLNPASAAETGLVLRYVSAGANGIDYWARAYVRIATLPNAATAILGFGDAAQATRGRIILNTDGTLSAAFDTGGSQQNLGPGATTLATNTWYRLGFRLKRHLTTPDTGADEGEVFIDGVSELSSTALSIGGNPSRLLVGANLFDDTATALDIFFDDVALNDSNGTNQTGSPGAGTVVALFPNGSGEFEQLITLNSATCASVPAATAWQSTDDGAATGTVDTVDCATFTDNAADWTGLGSRLAVAMGNLAESASSVALVAFGVRVRTETAANAQYVWSAQTADGGTKATDVSTTVNTVDFVLNNTNTFRAASPFTLYVDPAAAAWTTGTVNSLQMLMRAGDAAPDIHVTAMWATVEYTPNVGGGPTPVCTLAMAGVGC